MLMLGFHGTTVPDSLARLLEAPLVTGVIWFRRNIVDTEQVARVNERLHALRPGLLVAIDQEGGPVRRLREGVTDVPAMRQVQSEDDARAWGHTLGRELRALGFNMNMAPVLDVDSNPDNPIIGERAFSADPERVALLGIALHEGLVAEGVASCGKHFPGHGDTETDSHLELPNVRHGLDRLRAVELVPFEAAIRAGLPSVMTAHVLLPALDPDWPATLSPRVIERLLRQELGYDGVVISDDLEMKAVADRWGIEPLVERCLTASVDPMLVCHELERQQTALRVLESAAPERTDRGRRRVRELAERFAIG